MAGDDGGGDAGGRWRRAGAGRGGGRGAGGGSNGDADGAQQGFLAGRGDGVDVVLVAADGYALVGIGIGGGAADGDAGVALDAVVIDGGGGLVPGEVNFGTDHFGGDG